MGKGDDKTAFLEALAELLGSAREWSVDIKRGLRRIERPGAEFAEFEPTDGYTITLELNGGAIEELVEPEIEAIR